MEQQSVKTGHWVYDINGMDWDIPAWRCSECGGRNDNIRTTIRYGNEIIGETNPYRWAGSQYCPHCGIKMEKPPIIFELREGD